MGDAMRRPLRIPPWQIPYLEKHRIFELFHELARELVIQKPDDHVEFLKYILLNASKSKDVSRAILFSHPKVNLFKIVQEVVKATNQRIIHGSSLEGENLEPKEKVNQLQHMMRMGDVYERGWILIDCIKNEQEAKALVHAGILPTHVIYLIPNQNPPLNEILYCNVPTDWPEFRRDMTAIRDVFKKNLKEVYIQQKRTEEIAAEIVALLNIRPAIMPIKPRILLLGPRGSGRKTQAQHLVDNLNLIHVDFERLICKVWMSESELGERLRACKDEACYHSEILSEIVHRRVLEDDCLHNGWVLTGFPYSESDFKFLDRIFTPPNRVIFLEIDPSVCRERIRHRRVNVHTGSVTDISKDHDAKKQLEVHPRDNEDLLDAELSHYCENYGALRKYCGKTANCVNGDQSERNVYECIMAIISRGPNAGPPRDAGKDDLSHAPSSNSDDSLCCCCCSPIPSFVDTYVSKI